MIKGVDMSLIARSPKNLGHAIREARKAAGLSQGELAARSGLWQETISKVENGHAGTKLETVFELLAALDLELVARARSKGSASDFEDLF
tara:strand:- start:1720 stop:1989 length:270 start_codon:yes stop_codon:yes gene_type:complete